MKDSQGNRLPDLDGLIESAIAMFEDELEDMWQDKDYGEKINNFSGQVANLILDSSENLLVAVDPSSWRRIPGFLENQDLKEDVLLALELETARRYLPLTLDM